jgi:hypothetical protein
MKYALQIHGQLRSFEYALPTLLHFIQYSKYDYDVFLFINRGKTENFQYNDGSCLHTDANFNEENLNKLLSMLQNERIKCIRYTSDMSESEKQFEKQKLEEYQSLWSKFNAKYGEVSKHDVGPALIYRRYLLNNMRIDYERKHNLFYDYVVQTRFDYGTSYMKPYDINPSTTPIMFSDCLTIGTSEFINKESECALYWPITPTLLFDEQQNLILEKYRKYENWKGDKFIEKHWMFMPELNIRLFLLENSYNFIEAWWEEPCNYGFTRIR